MDSIAPVLTIAHGDYLSSRRREASRSGSVSNAADPDPLWGPRGSSFNDPADNARGMNVQAPSEMLEHALNKQFRASELARRRGPYMPIAWYPESTYSVVPVTFFASSLRRKAAAAPTSFAST